MNPLLKAAFVVAPLTLAAPAWAQSAEDLNRQQMLQLQANPTMTPAPQPYPQAAARAKRLLDAGEVRKRASPSLAVLLSFRDAKTCEQKHALLDAVRDKADARMLPELRPYEAVRGCGYRA